MAINIPNGKDTKQELHEELNMKHTLSSSSNNARLELMQDEIEQLQEQLKQVEHEKEQLARELQEFKAKNH